MKNEPYAGMGEVTKNEGLYLENKKKPQMAFYLAHDQWASVPVALMDDPTSVPNDYIVYLVVNSFVDRVTATAFPTYKRITKRAKRCLSVIAKTMSHLVEIGWATKIKRGQGRADITILHARKGQKFTKEQLKAIKDVVEGKITDFRKSNRYNK